MNEDFVSFELALKLKDKGFDKFCENGYFLKSWIKYSTPNNDSVLVSSIGEIIFNTECCWFEEEIEYGRDIIYAPTISQVLKWLREEKKIHVTTGVTPKSAWRYIIMFCDERGLQEPTITEKNHLDYSDAIIAGIEYVLDNLI